MKNVKPWGEFALTKKGAATLNKEPLEDESTRDETAEGSLLNLPRRVITYRCEYCNRDITFDTFKPWTGVCLCGFAIMIEEDNEKGFSISYVPDVELEFKHDLLDKSL